MEKLTRTFNLRGAITDKENDDEIYKDFEYIYIASLLDHSPAIVSSTIKIGYNKGNTQ